MKGLCQCMCQALGHVIKGVPLLCIEGIRVCDIKGGYGGEKKESQCEKEGHAKGVFNGVHGLLLEPVVFFCVSLTESREHVKHIIVESR